MSNNQSYSVKEKIDVAAGRVKADIVFKNVRVADVFNREWLPVDVAVHNGQIVGLGKYDGLKNIDGKGQYLCPGFIDGHVHIESSMVTPQELSKVLLTKGVTTIIADPHEIANVSGKAGIQYMLDASENLALHVYLMLPSCVPSVSFEHSGAVLTSKDLAPFYEHPRVLGLAEVMNYPAVLNGEEDMLNKILTAREKDSPIDGHAAGLTEEDINVYRTAGIATDHEAVTAEEGKIRLQRGMWLMLREGTASRDLNALLPVITEQNAHRCLFVTDDKHLDDMMENGSIDGHICQTIASGIPAITAIAMASYHAAQCFGLKQKGAIAPGFDADLVLINDLEKMKITAVYSKGECVASQGEYCGLKPSSTPLPKHLCNSVNLVSKNLDLSIAVPDEETKVHIIGVIPHTIQTEHVIETTSVKNGYFSPCSNRDHMKIAVVERHSHRATVGKGIVKGMTFTDGAIAQTIAHDSHHLMVCGTNDTDMLTAIKHIEQTQGGIAIVKHRKVIASLPLTISGLMTDKPYQEVIEHIKQIQEAIVSLGFKGDFDPLLTLSFLALPVIPSLKVTDQGLFDVKAFEFINVTDSMK